MIRKSLQIYYFPKLMKIFLFVLQSLKAELWHIPFEKLDFGVTETLDKFYNANVALVDLSEQVQQRALFYHIGVREMGMPETIVLLHHTENGITLSVKVTHSILLR